MLKEELKLVELDFTNHNQIVLDFFKDNVEFFNLFENISPDLAYVENIFKSIPNGLAKESKFVLGCFRSSHLVGFSELIKDRHRKGEWLLGLLIISGKVRKSVLGGRVILEFFKYIKASGAKAIIGGVVEGNQLAIKFWESTGAKAADTLYNQEMNGKIVPTRLMYKEL